VHEGPGGYKRWTREAATVKASQWDVVQEESWKLERGEDERRAARSFRYHQGFARTCIPYAHTLGSFSQANIKCL
jgi:hypothetical protein